LINYRNTGRHPTAHSILLSCTYQTLNTHWVRICWVSRWGGSARWVWSWMELIQKLQDKGRQTNALCRRGSYSPQCQTTSKLNPKPASMMRCRVTLHTWIQHHDPGGTYQTQNHTGSGAVGEYAGEGAHTGSGSGWSLLRRRYERIGITRRRNCKPPDVFAY
jgi:hypothetical protein